MHRGTILDLPKRQPGDVQSPCAACTIRDLSICSVLKPEELPSLTDIVTDISISPGQAVFFEGDPADHLFVLRDGCARVCKVLADGRRMITGFFFPSDIVGLAEDVTYAYSCEAVTRISLCRFPRKALKKLFVEFPVLEQHILSVATNELAAAQDQMVLLGRKTASEKLASFLLLLSSRAGRRHARRDELFLPMSRNDIGDHLGLTTESVSRCFTRLRKQEIIRLDAAHTISILDRDRLLALSGSGEFGIEPSVAVL